MDTIENDIPVTAENIKYFYANYVAGTLQAFAMLLESCNEPQTQVMRGLAHLAAELLAQADQVLGPVPANPAPSAQSLPRS